MATDTGELLMRSLAGLGLFFFGIKMITRNLSAMAGDQFRRGLDSASKRGGVAIAFGTASGFVTQSGRTTSFILASFVQAGLIDARRAIPIVLWANFGCTLVIFTAVFPIQLLALALIAVGGVLVAFERPKPLLAAVSAMFGLALMLYGLQMMSSAASVMMSFSWFASALDFIRLSLVFAFLMGLALTLVAQSHIAIMLIAVTMASKHIFDFDQTLMVIYGAHAGSSVNTWLAGVNFQGKPRQVVTAQALYNVVGVGLFSILFGVEQFMFGHSVLLPSLVHRVTNAPGIDAALVAVLLNFVTPLLISAVLPLYITLCERLSPPQHHEELSKPEYLRDEVSGNSVASLILIEKEQLRLLRRLPVYCAWIRGEARDGPTPRAYHDAFVQVNKHIQRFQHALLSQRLTPEDTEWLLNQQRRDELLAALDETCLELAEASDKLGAEAEHIRRVVVEALDTFFLTAISGVERNDAQEFDMLETMTHDRGPAMERMRNRYLTTADRVAADERNRVLQITSLFERGAWCLNRFAALQRHAPAFATATVSEPAAPVVAEATAA